MVRRAAFIGLLGMVFARPVHAQGLPDLELPTSGLAGTPDVLSQAKNPAQSLYLESTQIGLAATGAFGGPAVRTGQGVGLFAASSLGGGFLPRFGLGLGVEYLRPPARLGGSDNDTTRLTLSNSLPLGPRIALGFGWHHYFGGALAHTDTFTAGAALRLGSMLSLGMAVRDLFGPRVQGVSIERNYEAEVAARPLETDRLELAVSGRIGEDSGNIGAGARAIFKIVDGVYLRGGFDTIPLRAGMTEAREYRVSAGLELVFPGLHMTAYATGSDLDAAGGEPEVRGGTATAIFNPKGPPALFEKYQHIEKIELKEGLSEMTLLSTVSQLRRIARDETCVAVLVQFNSLDAGWAALTELRDELLRVRKAKKKVFVHMVAGSTQSYFVASAADEIYVDPAGGIRLQGFSGTNLYFKGLFDKLGVQAQFERIEEFKSAPESYTETGPTQAAELARNELFDSMYDELISAIAAGRHLPPERVRTLLDNGPYTAGDLAKRPELVDAIGTTDDVPKLMAKTLGHRYPFGGPVPHRAERWSVPRIAIIFIDGDIIDGQSRTVPVIGQKMVGGQTISDAISAARGNPSIEAIVLRINSPGGSALASELMSREVFKTRGVKPILCSLGDYAASGGYFAAAGCDYILSSRMTITGSIGIFNGKFDVSALLTRLGLSWKTYKRGEHSDLESTYRPLSEEERQFMKSKLQYYYGRFIKAVADGRKMKTAAVDNVGRGRVWTGAQAKSLGLVDDFGGLGDAIAMAKIATGHRPNDLAELVLLPRDNRSFLQRMVGGLVKEDRTDIDAAALLLMPGFQFIRQLPWSLLVEPEVPQARLPFVIQWNNP